MELRGAGVQKKYERAARLMSSVDRLRRVWMGACPPVPMKRGDMMLLGRLIELENQGKPPLSLGQLAKMMHQSPPGITQKVNALEEQGLVQRVPGKNDRRVSCIQLTDKGRKTGKQALKQFLSSMEAALDRMGKEKAEALLSLLEDLGGALEETENEKGEGARALSNTANREGDEPIC